jgi:hypothetical protein
MPTKLIKSTMRLFAAEKAGDAFILNIKTIELL